MPAHYYLVLKSYLSDRHFYVRHRDASSEIYSINAGVPQGSVLGPVLYTIFTSDMPTLREIEVATFADDTAFIASSGSPIEASSLLQNQLNMLEVWLNKWKIKVNSEKSTHVTFALRKEECPAVFLNNKQIPTRDKVKYLGMHLDRRLTWKSHIQAKQQQLKIKTKRMYWLLGRKSQLSIENKIRLYKAILKPIWTYGIQLWGTASKSNVEILQRYQSKTLRSLINAPWFVTNEAIHNDLGIPFIKNEIPKYSARYLARLSNHINPIAVCLLDTTYETIRLKRSHILDLPFL